MAFQWSHWESWNSLLRLGNVTNNFSLVSKKIGGKFEFQLRNLYITKQLCFVPLLKVFLMETYLDDHIEFNIEIKLAHVSVIKALSFAHWDQMQCSDRISHTFSDFLVWKNLPLFILDGNTSQGYFKQKTSALNWFES